MSKRLTADEIEARAKAAANKVRCDEILRACADDLRVIASALKGAKSEETTAALDDIAKRIAKAKA